MYASPQIACYRTVGSGSWVATGARWQNGSSWQRCDTDSALGQGGGTSLVGVGQKPLSHSEGKDELEVGGTSRTGWSW